jgi:hypothetical protein
MCNGCRIPKEKLRATPAGRKRAAVSEAKPAPHPTPQSGKALAKDGSLASLPKAAALPTVAPPFTPLPMLDSIRLLQLSIHRLAAAQANAQQPTPPPLPQLPLSNHSPHPPPRPLPPSSPLRSPPQPQVAPHGVELPCQPFGQGSPARLPPPPPPASAREATSPQSNLPMRTSSSSPHSMFPFGSSLLPSAPSRSQLNATPPSHQATLALAEQLFKRFSASGQSSLRPVGAQVVEPPQSERMERGENSPCAAQSVAADLGDEGGNPLPVGIADVSRFEHAMRNEGAAPQGEVAACGDALEAERGVHEERDVGAVEREKGCGGGGRELI